MLGLAGVPSVIQFIGFIWLPETSRWLAANGRDDEARATINKIRGAQYVDEEFNDIQKMVIQQKKEREESKFTVDISIHHAFLYRSPFCQRKNGR